MWRGKESFIFGLEVINIVKRERTHFSYRSVTFVNRMWLMCKWAKQYIFFSFYSIEVQSWPIELVAFCYCGLGYLGQILIKNPYKPILYFWKDTVINLKILNLIQSSTLEELSEGYKGYYNTNAMSCNIFRFVMKLLVKSAAKGEQRPINEYRGHATILWGHMSMI